MGRQWQMPGCSPGRPVCAWLSRRSAGQRAAEIEAWLCGETSVVTLSLSPMVGWFADAPAMAGWFADAPAPEPIATPRRTSAAATGAASSREFIRVPLTGIASAKLFVNHNHPVW